MIERDLSKHLGFHEESPSITANSREGKKKQIELPLSSPKTATSESSSFCDPVKIAHKKES